MLTVHGFYATQDELTSSLSHRKSSDSFMFQEENFTDINQLSGPQHHTSFTGCVRDMRCFNKRHEMA